MDAVRILALGLLVAGGVGGCILAPEPAACAGAATCAECLGRSGCGWCAQDGACRPGSSFGADDGACRRDQWRWTRCDGPTGPMDRCASRSFCSTCRDEDGCGWCFDGDGACLAGGLAGPSEGSCQVWAFGDAGGECYDLECHAPSTCGDCLGRGCYWCTAGGYCLSSTDPTRECDLDYEISPHTGPSCPPTDECWRGSTCESCTAIPGCVQCFDYDDILDRYDDYGCHPPGYCPTLTEYTASEPFECPREL